MTTRTMRRAAPGLAALALIAMAGPAWAQDPVSCRAIEIGATKAAAPSIPGDLKPLEKKLTKPPLSSWNSFTVMSSSDLSLETMKPASPKLASGAATYVLRDVDKREGKRPRFTIGITMDGQGGKRVVDTKVSVDAGDYVILGETLPSNDGHFVALTCKL